MSSSILVTGATGNVGGELVRALAREGQPVRALVRRESDRARLPAGVDAAVGDLNRPRELAAAFDGVRAVHLLSGYEDMPGFLAEARRAGVEHVVLQSSSAVPGGDTSNAVARYHILAEAAVRESGLTWTFLQPNSFMTNTLQWVPQLRAGDLVRDPFADVPVAIIDPYDIAAVAAGGADLARSRRPQLPAERSGIAAASRPRSACSRGVLGRQLRFEGQSNDEARAEMSETMPVEYVDAFMSFFADGALDESRVSADRPGGDRPAAPLVRAVGRSQRGRVPVRRGRSDDRLDLAPAHRRAVRAATPRLIQLRSKTSFSPGAMTATPSGSILWS